MMPELFCLVELTGLQDYFLICYKCYLHRFCADIFDTSDLILRRLLYVKSVVECNTPTSRKPTHTRFTQDHRILKISCVVLCSFNMRSSVFIFIQRTLKETVGRRDKLKVDRIIAKQSMIFLKILLCLA